MMWFVSRIGAVTACVLAIACGEASLPSQDASISRYLYVWAWDLDKRDSDFLAVIDVDPESAEYGEVLATSAVGVVGGAHHTEHDMPEGGRLFVNSFSAGATFVMNLTDPLRPRIESSFSNAGPYAFPHSFERTPTGTVLATFQARADDRSAVGGLVELDTLGNMIRGTDAASPIDPELRPYSLAVVPRLDRVVTTSADMAGEYAGRSFQVWRLSDLALLHTVLLPPGPRGDENLHVAEARVLADGESVIVTTFVCGMYLVRGLDGDAPEVDLVWTFPWKPGDAEDTDCALPVQLGRYWVQTVATTGSLVVLDLSDPREPQVADELTFGDDARPHWISREPGGDRIVLTGGGSLTGRVLLLSLDPDRGRLTVLEDFRSPGATRAGVDFARERWPHGETGPAFPHGAVFARPTAAAR